MWVAYIAEQSALYRLGLQCDWTKPGFLACCSSRSTGSSTSPDAVLHDNPDLPYGNAGFYRGRGEVSETFAPAKMHALGLPLEFASRHEAQLTSVFGTIRGLHGGPFSKLVNVAYGRVRTAVLDARPDSPTFGEIEMIDLDAGHVLFVPSGCANSAATLSPLSVYNMRFDGTWSAAAEDIRVTPVDETLNINWGLSFTQRIIAPRDLEADPWLVCAKRVETEHKYTLGDNL